MSARLPFFRPAASSKAGPRSSWQRAHLYSRLSLLITYFALVE